MPFFETSVQEIKYKVLKKVAELAYADALNPENTMGIAEEIIPEGRPTMRCCIYKERAIINQRVSAAIGGGGHSRRAVRVLPIACDECPIEGIQVTHSCRGCIAHYCMNACPKGAISIVNLRATIDKSKCVECGQCAKVCPYSAIANHKRPCENACKVKAIAMNNEKAAKIDNSKCISCGACVYQCPFGAISDKSYIINVIDFLKKSNNNENYKVYAVVAPSISSQFTYAKLGQVITGIKKLGFFTVVEAALGADMVADAESEELVEKGFLTSSCCPAFVDYIKKQFPALVDHISHNLSPMAAIAKYIKESAPGSKVIFIGPCTAKKMEFRDERVRPYIDCVITFEELQALFDSRDFDLSTFEEDVLDNASYFGRIFARSGGLADAVREALKEHGREDFDYRPVACDGIEACRAALLKAGKNVLPGNFIEGMACMGGCIGGAGCLTHGEKNKAEVDKYGMEAIEKTIADAIGILQ